MLTETDLASEVASTATVLLDRLHRYYPGFGSWYHQSSGT